QRPDTAGWRQGQRAGEAGAAGQNTAQCRCGRWGMTSAMTSLRSTLSRRGRDAGAGGGWSTVDNGTHYSDDIDGLQVVRATRITWLSTLAVAVLLVWSYFAELVEVSTGDGRVIPISREQVIQSL